MSRTRGADERREVEPRLSYDCVALMKNGDLERMIDQGQQVAVRSKRVAEEGRLRGRGRRNWEERVN